MVEKSVKSISSNKTEQNIEDSPSEFSLRLSMLCCFETWNLGLLDLN